MSTEFQYSIPRLRTSNNYSCLCVNNGSGASMHDTWICDTGNGVNPCNGGNSPPAGNTGRCEIGNVAEGDNMYACYPGVIAGRVAQPGLYCYDGGEQNVSDGYCSTGFTGNSS
jgi:hypothetical protein